MEIKNEKGIFCCQQISVGSCTHDYNMGSSHGHFPEEEMMTIKNILGFRKATPFILFMLL
jgi:hypothetical protein